MSLLNKHACFLFSRRNYILLAVIWGHFIGQQHHILPKYSSIKFEGNFQPTLKKLYIFYLSKRNNTLQIHEDLKQPNHLWNFMSKGKQLQLHKLFDIIVKLICVISKYEAGLSGEHFMSIFGHIFCFFCLLNTLPVNFYHSIFHLSHFCTCP